MGAAAATPRGPMRGATMRDAEIEYACPRKSDECQRIHRFGTRQVSAACIEMLEEIAQGSRCKIYKARFHNTKKRFAVKVFDCLAIESREYEREVAVLRVLASSKVKCEFLVEPLFSIRSTHIAVEFCPGGDLATLLSRRVIEPDELRKFAFEIAEGLHFLHMRMIIHEDIKPGNIGLTIEHHVRILDFGVSEILSEPAPEASSEQINSHDTNSMVSHRREPVSRQSMTASSRSDLDCNRLVTLSKQGTLPYASPEKLSEIPHSFEADWWSYGVLVYEMLTGNIPWFAKSAAELSNRICKDPLRVPEILRPSLDPEVLSFVQDLIGSKDPLDRLGWRRGLRDLEEHPFFRSIEIQ